MSQDQFSLKFTAVYQRDKETGVYVGFIQEFPFLVAEGLSMKEVRQDIRIGLREALAYFSFMASHQPAQNSEQKLEFEEPVFEQIELTENP